MPGTRDFLPLFALAPWNLSEGVDSFGFDVRRGDKAEDLEILRRDGTTDQTGGSRHGLWPERDPARRPRRQDARPEGIVHEGATAEEVRQSLSPKGSKS